MRISDWSSDVCSSDLVVRRFALFDYGFRPFFLLGALYAIVALGAWLLVLSTGDWPENGLQPQDWHAHEMLFGFVAAAITGFMLPAIPNWTGRKGYSGAPLIFLVGLWRAEIGRASCRERVCQVV